MDCRVSVDRQEEFCYTLQVSWKAREILTEASEQLGAGRRFLLCLSAGTFCCGFGDETGRKPGWKRRVLLTASRGKERIRIIA